MLRFAVFALLVAASSALSVSPARNPFHYAKGVRGPVEGIVPCGSQGEVLEVRVTDCTTLPCAVTVGSTYTIEVDFKPAAAHQTLTVLVTMIQGGEETVIVKDEVPAVVSPGNAYTLEYPWTISDSAPRGLLALRIQLTGDGVVELCGLATVRVSDP